MKWLGRPSPFHMFTNPCVINRFIFGQGVVIYYIPVRSNFQFMPHPVTVTKREATYLTISSQASKRQHMLCNVMLFCICQNAGADQQLISAVVFAT